MALCDRREGATFKELSAVAKYKKDIPLIRDLLDRAMTMGSINSRRVDRETVYYTSPVELLKLNQTKKVFRDAMRKMATACVACIDAFEE